MRRRDFLAAAGAAGASAAIPQLGFAQTKVRRVALVTGGVAAADMRIGGDSSLDAFLREIESLGFVEGRSVNYDRYLMPETLAATSTIAQDNARTVLATAPDVIFWGGAPTTALAALALNKTIPMVVEAGDLLAQGVVSNLGRPGANATGMNVTGGPDAEGKVLAVIAEAIPSAKTFAYAQSGSDGQFRAAAQGYVQSVTDTASKLRLTMIPVIYAPGGGEAEFTKVFAAIASSKVDMAVLGSETSVSATAQQAFIAQLALAARLPAIAPYSGFAEQGGLLSYGANLVVIARRCADYVAAIIRGANPADMPVGEPDAFDFVVNLKTAKAIGIDIPQTVLIQATKVIE